MKTLLRILCIVLALCMLCSCSKIASDKLDDSQDDDAPITDVNESEIVDEAPYTPDTPENTDIETPPEAPEVPEITGTFHRASGFGEVLSVINGNSDIPYGVFPPEALSADGSMTVMSLNGFTPLVNEPSSKITDGDIKYTVSQGVLCIYEGDTLLSETVIFTDSYTNEDLSTEFSYGYENASSLYLDGSRLAVVTSAFSYKEVYNESTDTWDASNYDFVNVYFCDVSDLSAPRVTKTISQDGIYASSAILNGRLYVVTSIMINSVNPDVPTSYIPHIHDSEASAPVKAENIYIFEYSTCAGFTMISEYDLETEKAASSAAVLGGIGRLYIDETDIYMVFFSEVSEPKDTYEENNISVEEYTEHCISAVIKFSMSGGCEAVGTSTADGCFTGDFSLYTKDGSLYFCAVSEKSTYGVYTDKESGTVTRRDLSAEIENILYAISPDLKEVRETPLPNEEISYARFEADRLWVGYLNSDRSFDITTGTEILP